MAMPMHNDNSLRAYETGSGSRSTDLRVPTSAAVEAIEDQALLFDERLDHFKPLHAKLFYACRPTIKEGARLLLKHVDDDNEKTGLKEQDFMEQVSHCLEEVLSLHRLCNKAQRQGDVEDTMLYWRCEHLKQDLEMVETCLSSIFEDPIRSLDQYQDHKRNAKAILKQYRNDPKDLINVD